jgi:hypothetical protein
MSSYFFSFRLSEKTTPRGTYDERYNALYETIRQMSNGWWLKPTSFGVFYSNQSADGVLAQIATAIDEAVDLFVLGKIDYLGIWVLGNYTDSDAEILGSMIKDLHLR